MTVLQDLSDTPGMVFPASVDEALAVLDEHGGDARIIAGGTWLMRSESRGERLPALLVSLDRIADVSAVVQRGTRWSIGSMVSHDTLSQRFGTAGTLAALGQAAGISANPGVRRLATLGGNIASEGFAAADLVPALLALDASVTVAQRDGTASMSVEDFLAGRKARTKPFLITGVEIGDDGGPSAHARLTMRKAGEYPVAIVSVAATLSAGKRIGSVRIAVGSVEAIARRWRALEQELSGRALDSGEFEALAKAALGAFAPRDGVDAPSWYRLDVLPHLVRTAFADIEQQAQE